MTKTTLFPILLCDTDDPMREVRALKEVCFLLLDWWESDFRYFTVKPKTGNSPAVVIARQRQIVNETNWPINETKSRNKLVELALKGACIY